MATSSWCAVRALRLLALAALAVTLAACMREPQPPLRIGTNVWIGSEPLYLARDLGYLDRNAAQLVEYPSASEVSRAFRNEAIDGMVISLDELFVLAVDGLRPRVVTIVDVSHGADVVVGRRGMQKMSDLKGKRIAVESAALGAFVLSRALAVNGMQASDVSMVHLESNEHPAAFQQGRVDGAVTFDPYRTQLLAAGARTLFDSSQIPGEIVDLLAVRDTVLEKNPHAVNAMLQAWFKALAYLRHEPADAAARMAVREQISKEQFLHALQGLRFPSYAENLHMLGGPAPSLLDSGRKLMTLMVDAKLLRNGLEIKELLAPEALQRLPPP
jgi:NitT/TauT family transport system substrate-binding protein